MDVEFIKQMTTDINNVVGAQTKPLYEKIEVLRTALVDIRNLPIQAADYEKAIRFYCNKALADRP